jgi:UDP-GlcNAc3NAcA epimerase
MLRLLERDFTEHRPDAVLLYGDTNSTLAGALAAAKLHIAVLHVEAGLRSFNRNMPEETNRVLTDHVSEMLFAPTDLAVENLRREGLGDRAIVRTGDIMYDVALRARDKAASSEGVLAELSLAGKPFVLATIHRAENTDDPTRLLALLTALGAVAALMRVVLPLHPRTKKKIADSGFEDRLGNIEVIEPVGYIDMVRLLSNAAVVATDSGGVQKEAYFYRVPCVTLREETEWKELIDTGWNRLASGTDENRIAETVLKAVGASGEPVQLYGDGHAAEQIADSIASHFSAKRADDG